MAQLILFWGNKNDVLFTWHLFNKTKNAVQAEQSIPSTYQLENHELLKADLACIADMAKEYDVFLVLSSIDVNSAQILVPNKAKKLLRKAVPYMLEDEIATPVDDLFFAFSDKTKDNLLTVRAIEIDYLESLIECFKTAEVKLSNISIDLDYIEMPQEGYKLVKHHSEILVVDSFNNRWQCHQDDFTWLVQKQLDSKSEKNEDDNDLPIAIPMEVISVGATDQFEHQLPVGRFAINNEQVNDYYKYLLSQSTESINLLQAQYEVKKENSELTQFLTKAATVIGFVLLTHLVYQGINVVALSEQVTQLEAQKHTLYKQAFPNSRKVRRPEKEMRIHLKKMGASTGNNDFLSLLNSTSEKLTDLSKIYPTNISYESSRSELRFDVIASDLVVLDQYAADLKASGHKVERSSETQRGEGYSSRLVISK